MLDLLSRRLFAWRSLGFLLGAAIVLLTPPILELLPLTHADRSVKLYALLGASSFIAAGVWFQLGRLSGRASSWLADLISVVVIFAPLMLLLLLPAQTAARFPGLPAPLAPQKILLATAVLGAILLLVVQRLHRGNAVLTLILAIAATSVAFVNQRLAHITAQRVPMISLQRINTSLYPLRVTFFENSFKRLESRGGTLAPLGKDLLLVTADGDFYRIEHPMASLPLVVHRLPFHTPMNRADFATGTATYGLDVGIRRFRTASMLVQESGDHLRIFATYHFWNAVQRCTVVRLSSIEGRTDELLANANPQWKTWFETSPCLSVERGKEIYFGGISEGGRLVQPNDHELLVSIGDHEFEGVGGLEPIAQEPDKNYGKTILLNLTTGQTRIYSLGHRNPQGLYIDANQRIWETEHGPQGGDELNLIKEGRNYGWPFVTYGVDYGSHEWPANKTNGRHPGFEGPRFAWVPSIATSGMTGIRKDLFNLWNGDLLVGGLNGKAIWRVRVVDDDRVTVTEPIPMAHRIRDILEDQEGRLVIWTDEGALGLIEPESTPTTPGSLFAWRCSACHAIADGTQHKLGPDLDGVVGRNIGSARGFPYSQALQMKDGSWTDASLQKFLEDPQAFAPGTSMPAPQFANRNEIEKIVGFLRARGKEN